MTNHVRSRLLGAVLLLSTGTATLFAPAAAQALEYWPLICRGPLPQIIIGSNVMTVIARAGKRPANPGRGACVWLDRPVDRPGEARADGSIVIRLHTRGPVLRSVHGRVRWQPQALSVWNRNNNGRIFRIDASRVGTGIYRGRFSGP